MSWPHNGNQCNLECKTALPWVFHIEKGGLKSKDHVSLYKAEKVNNKKFKVLPKFYEGKI